MSDPRTEMTEPSPAPPGALSELRDPSSRKRFLRLGGAGLAGALAMTLAACGSDEGGGEAAEGPELTTEPKADPGLRPFGEEGDLAIANYALTLEYLESDFYEEAVSGGLLKGEALELAKRFGEQEQTHVTALRRLIEGAGGTPVERPKTRFEFEDAQTLLRTAATVEDLGAAAYLGQAARIASPEILAAALSIHSVEARHAAVLLELTGAEPAPRAFAEPADAATVLEAVTPFIVSEES